MDHIGIFDGIGGFSLAAKWMGWETKAWCEIDTFCQKVLKYYYPDADPFGDIKTTDFTKYANRIDILTGGFPCQPYSVAGKRLGKEDDRHLWPHMLRAVRQIRPRYVVGENVRGLVSWNGGMVFDQVQADLEAEGYEVLPFLLPACGVNAPHRRDRIWVVAHSCINVYTGGLDTGRNRNKAEGSEGENEQQTGRDENGERLRVEPGTGGKDVTNANGFGLSVGNDKQNRRKSQPVPERQDGVRGWRNWPTQSPLCGRNDGLSSRLSGITVPKHRNESLKAYGNAIVPQVAYQIFKTIEQYEKTIYNHSA